MSITDRAIGRVSALEERGLDDRTKPLGREHGTVQLEGAIGARFRAADGVDALTPRILGRALRRLDRLDLVRPLAAPALAEIISDDKLDPHLTQAIRLGEWKIRRDRDALHAARIQEALHDRRPELAPGDASTRKLLRAVLVHVHDRRRSGFLACAAFFERARDDDELLDVLERDDRIRREESGHVIDVRELVTVRVKEERHAARGIDGFGHVPPIYRVAPNDGA